MNIMSLLMLVAVVPVSAFAGFQKRTCETANKTIVMGGENLRIKLKTTSDGQPVVYDYPVNLMPEFKSNNTSNETIAAIPISVEVIVSKLRQREHITHKDGTSCDGRERWNDESVQTYVLTSNGGEPLYRLAPSLGKSMTPEMYIISNFNCHSEGLTSSGGCYVNDGDTVTWEEIDNINQNKSLQGI